MLFIAIFNASDEIFNLKTKLIHVIAEYYKIKRVGYTHISSILELLIISIYFILKTKTNFKVKGT